MAREREIKLRVVDRAAFHAALKRLGARLVSRRVHEWNEVLDTPSAELRRRGQLLRIRAEGKRAGLTLAGETKLTFKGPAGRGERQNGTAGRHKVLRELEVAVKDGEVLRAVLKQLGMQVWFRYEKYRSTYRLPASKGWARGLLIELDETPVGLFVELEGPARAIDRAAKALGYTKRDYIVANYYLLYREACRWAGRKAGDMVFSKRKSGGREE